MKISESKQELARIYAPTIEQLATDYRNRRDYAKRLQKEADEAVADANARLKALEAAIAEIGFTINPIAAGKQEHELVITDWRDLQIGDIIKYVDGDIKSNNGPNKGRLGCPRKWSFIRRP